MDHRLFVSDNNNARVTAFNLDSNDEPLDYSADYVIGQPDMYTANGSDARNKLISPDGIAIDQNGHRLFVSDGARIMTYDISSGAIANGMNASFVLGQKTFTSGIKWRLFDHAGKRCGPRV